MRYTIKNEYLNIEIDNHGAELKRINSKNYEFLHDSNPLFWGRSAPYLFPNIGTIKDKYTIIDGTKYPLTKHGFIRDVDFELQELKDTEITFSFISNDFTKNLYPFDFKFIVNYKLVEKKLETTIEITNLSETEMPFNFGLHPAFKIPFDNKSEFEAFEIDFDKQISAQLPTVNLSDGTIDWNKTYKTLKNIKNLKLNHEDYSNDALVIEPCPKHISINSPTGKSIEVITKDFLTLGIWTPYPLKAPFICIEPWIGCADKPTTNHEFNTKKDLITLYKNSKWMTSFIYKFNF